MSAHNLAAQTDFNVFSAGEQDNFKASHDFGRTKAIAEALPQKGAETRPLNLNRRIPLDHLSAWSMIEVQVGIL